MVEHQLPKLRRRVRFPLPAFFKAGNENRTARPRRFAPRERPSGTFESKLGLKGGGAAGGIPVACFF